MTVRWSAQDLQHYLRRGQPAPMAEAVFQAAVIRLAKQAGYLVHFTKDSRRSPEGYPDLTLAKAGQPLYVCELKREDGQVTPAQQAWLTALAGCTGVVSEVWRPSALEEICRKLRQ